MEETDGPVAAESVQGEGWDKMTMLERVKLAVTHGLLVSDEDGVIREDEEGLLILDGRFDLSVVATIILAAMREPTAEMIEAGTAAIQGEGLAGVATRDGWQAMIDAF